MDDTTHIAWVTTAAIPADVDPGITIVRDDSFPVAETGDLPEGWGQDPHDPENLDVDAVEAELRRLGYQLADAGWQRSGQQWAARVEPI